MCGETAGLFGPGSGGGEAKENNFTAIILFQVDGRPFDPA
jgi:hypothetical protein